MVQLQNSDRLTREIVFGTMDDGSSDDSDFATPQFVQIGKHTLCGNWSLTTNQFIQNAGNNLTGTFMIVVHHRNNWDGITRAKLGGKLYKVTDIQQDQFRNPTAYDQIILKRVDKNG